MIAAVVASATLCVLGALHLYWAAGGVAGNGAAVPTRDGKLLFTPSALGTAMVGVALFGAAALVYVTGMASTPRAHETVLRVGTGVVALAFAARAVGDFRYVGFFKRVRDSEFARRDSYIYSPVCLVLAGVVGAVAIG